MIRVEIELLGAVNGTRQVLGTLLLDNIGGGKKRDYRARMYKKGVNPLVTGDSHGKIREAKVLQHASEAEPVQNLVLKALVALGYKVPKEAKEGESG